MRFALIGILFYDKHFDRLKVICYYIAIVFLVLAAIEVMVGKNAHEIFHGYKGTS